MEANSKIITLTDAEFNKEVIMKANSVVVVFKADWCGSYHIIAPIIEKLAGEYGEQIRVANMDFDNNKKTSEEYGVRDIPTLLFFQNGQLVDFIIGTVSWEFLERKTKEILQNNGKINKM